MLGNTMYEVLETICAPRVGRWIMQKVIRCDTYEGACRWAQLLSATSQPASCLNVSYHVLATAAPVVLYSA